MRIKDFFKNSYSDELNFEAIEAIPEFAALKGCKQNSQWHQEGDAWVHTVNSTKALYGFMQHQSRSLIVAMLCHDLGKAPTAKFDETKGEWTSPNHGKVGEQITRNLLSDEPPIVREHVCEIVRHHMKLHYVLDKPTRDEQKQAIKKLLSELKFADFDEMWAINAADDFGSENGQTREERSERLRCLKDLYNEIVTEQTMPEVLTDRDFNYPVCVVLIGLPGSGKSSMVKTRYADMTCISRDTIRTELGYCGVNEKFLGSREQEDAVTEVFDQRFKDCIRQGLNVVIDNTNLRKDRRMSNVHSTILALNAKYRIIYHVIEAPIDVCCQRRKGEIDRSIIERMSKGYDFPSADECNKIIYSQGDQNSRPYVFYSDGLPYWAADDMLLKMTKVFTFDDITVRGTLIAANGVNKLYKLPVLDHIGFDGANEQEIKEKFPDSNIAIGEFLNSCFIIVNDANDNAEC